MRKPHQKECNEKKTADKPEYLIIVTKYKIRTVKRDVWKSS